MLIHVLCAQKPAVWQGICISLRGEGSPSSPFWVSSPHRVFQHRHCWHGRPTIVHHHASCFWPPEGEAFIFPIRLKNRLECKVNVSPCPNGQQPACTKLVMQGKCEGLRRLRTSLTTKAKAWEAAETVKCSAVAPHIWPLALLAGLRRGPDSGHWRRLAGHFILACIHVMRVYIYMREKPFGSILLLCLLVYVKVKVNNLNYLNNLNNLNRAFVRTSPRNLNI